ncbi:cytochrome b-c1 complex subunit 10 [Drosophila kikkawai]|uniref:Cytochrome b-c1 complex subunit 10 n=1 Tax=Drosophila kikkawai TaxID=30033 RepID=A0A6P4IEJ0_DROKI
MEGYFQTIFQTKMSIKKKLLSLYCRNRPSASQKRAMVAFAPSAATFGLAAAIGIVYFTDWRVVTDWIPLYNMKYPKPEKK